MTTECNAESFLFQSLGGREVVGRFDGGTITSDAGALLLRETERITGIVRQFASCFTDHRDPERPVGQAGIIQVGALHRTAPRSSSQPVIFYSDRGQVLKTSGTTGSPVLSDYYPTVITEATYIINVPAMKGHARAGVTLTGKLSVTVTLAAMDGPRLETVME